MKMDRTFWLPAIISFVLTIGGAMVALYSSYNSQQESIKDKAKADSINSEHQKLLKANYDKSLTIIANLNESGQKTKAILDSTTEVLKSQKEAGDLLINQIKASSEIQKSVESSGQKLVHTIENASKQMNDNLTGGEDYPEITFNREGIRKFTLSAKNTSNHVIPNLQIRVIDYDKVEECPTIVQNGIKVYNSTCFFNHTATEATMTYPPGTLFHLINSKAFINNSGKVSRLLIQIQTPNKNYFAELVYSVIDDENIGFNYRLYTLNGVKKNVIYQTDPENKQGIKWEEAFSYSPGDPLESF